MWRNEDAVKYKLAQAVLRGEHLWLEAGTMGVPYDADQLKPPSMEQIFEQREQQKQAAE